MPIQDLEDQLQLTNGQIQLHDIFSCNQSQGHYIFSLHIVTLTVFRQTHYHTGNNQIMEFKIAHTTYKNPTIRTACHTAHKGI